MTNLEIEFEAAFNKHNSQKGINPALMWRNIAVDEEWGKEKALAYREYSEKKDEQIKSGDSDD